MCKFLPEDLANWIAGQGGWENALPSQIIQGVEEAISMVAHRWTEVITGRKLSREDTALRPYCRRLWNCVEFHWRHFAETGPIQIPMVLLRLDTESTRDSSERVPNVLRDVVLAQALELRDPHAAELFDIEYLPYVRSVAYREGGFQAEDHFQNFAADLILTRDNRPPKLSRYQGKKPLRSWLRVVVVNQWRDHLRQQHEHASDLGNLVVASNRINEIDASPCNDLLQPIFGQAVASLDMEDRTILKLLVLDGVSQQKLAQSLGIHSGNLTRRRQKSSTQIFSEIHRLALASTSPQQSADCLDFILAGDDPEIKERLAELLTSELRAACATDNPGQGKQS